jgi:hypothetical protein
MTLATDEGTLEALGSAVERLVYEALVKIGLVPGVDFTWQSAFFGGRLDKGGLIIDFLFENPPGLAFSVLGRYWHYERGPEQRAIDLLQRVQMAGQGITLIFLDEDDVIADADSVVRAALNFEDRSELARG